MNQNNILERRPPTYFEKMNVYLLVGKVMVDREGKFALEEIEFAAGLPKEVEWENKNIGDLLNVVAGASVGDDVYDLCYAALTFPDDDNGGAQ